MACPSGQTSSAMAVGKFKVYEFTDNDVQFDFAHGYDYGYRFGAVNLDIHYSNRADHYRVYRARETDDISTATLIGFINDFTVYRYHPMFNVYDSSQMMFYDWAILDADTDYYYWVAACSDTHCKFSEAKRYTTLWPHYHCLEIDTYNKYTQKIESFVDIRIDTSTLSGCKEVHYDEARIYRSDTPQFNDAVLVQALPYGTKKWKDYVPVLPQERYYYYWMKLCNASSCSNPAETEFYADENVFNQIAEDKKAMLIVVEGGTASQREGVLGAVWDSLSSLQENSSTLLPATAQETIADINATIKSALNSFENLTGVAGEIVSVNGPLQNMLQNALNSLASVLHAQAEDMLVKLGRDFVGEIEKIKLRYQGMPETCTRLLDTLEAKGLPRSVDKEAMLDTYGEYWLGQCLSQIAIPYYDKVVLLTDENASLESFKNTLFSLHNDGYGIDLVYDNHGFGKDDSFSLNNRSNEGFGLCFYDENESNSCKYKDTLADTLMPKNDERNATLHLGSVYSVSCWGSGTNDLWLDRGAKEADGSYQTNYFVILSPIIYMYEYTHGGKSSKDASGIAYNTEKDYIFGSGQNIVSFDLRPTLNQVLPVMEKNPYSCGVEIGGIWFGLSESIDKVDNKDYCMGSVGVLSYNFEKRCPPFFNKVYRSGRDTCRFDPLGSLRDNAHWEYDLNLIRIDLIDHAFSIFYGNDISKPIDVAESSKRIHKIHASTQVDGLILEPNRIERDAQFIHFTLPGNNNKFETGRRK